MDRIDKKKVIITAIVTLILTIAGMIFGITYTQDDINKISDGIETVVNIVEDNQSTTEIPEAYIEDEQNLEEQEVESESFELQRGNSIQRKFGNSEYKIRKLLRTYILQSNRPTLEEQIVY